MTKSFRRNDEFNCLRYYRFIKRQVKFITAIQKCFCNKFIISLQVYNICNQYLLSSRLKEGTVEEEIGCSFYVSTTATYWVNTVLKVASKFMVMQMTQT